MKHIMLTACVILGVSGLTAMSYEAMAGERPPGKAEPKPPEAKQDLIDTLTADPNYSQLVAAVKAAGLVEALKGKGPFTLFAPTNEAFARLPKDRLEALLKPENKAELQKILKFHIIPASVASSDLIKLRESSKTLAGGTFMIATRDGKVRVGGDMRTMVNVTKTDVECSNGIVHTIDGLMIPPVKDNSFTKGPAEPE